MKKTSILFIISLIIFSLASCNKTNDKNTDPFDVAKSSLQRDTNPDVSDPDISELVTGNNTFALNLYSQINGGDNNLFYSPYSISIALAMTYAGAENNTRLQMADCLKFTLPEERLHPAFNYVDLALSSRGNGAAGADGGGFRLNVVNAIWGQKGYEFTSSYLDVLALNYGAGLNILDFMNSPDESRLIINQWVEDQTGDRIKDLLPQGSITDGTRLVLTNAIYFNAAWLNQFKEDQTSDGTFYLLDLTGKTVPMMHQTNDFGYIKGSDYQAVELPYDGNELSMIIILPDSGQFKSFESSLDLTALNAIINNLAETYIDISMPKWEFNSDGLSLPDYLSNMGMIDAFNPASADFSGIDGSRNLFIADVIHKAFVKVNEAGTEAAAATGVLVGETAAPPPPEIIIINRPFIYLIRDIETGTILFLGRVTDPSK